MRYFYWILAAIFFVIAGICLLTNSAPLGLSLLAVCHLLVYSGWRSSRRSSLSLKLGKIDAKEGQFLQELFQKAMDDFNYLQKSVKVFKDREIARQVMKMQQIARNMLLYLQKNPQKILQARPFIEYYQDRAVVLVDKYFLLEETQLRTTKVREAKERIKATLFSFVDAYEDQFSRLLNDQLLDVDAEIDVVNQMFHSDGVAPEHPETAAKAASEGKGADIFSGLDEIFRQVRSLGFGKRKEDIGRGSALIPAAEKWAVIRSKVIMGALGICLGGIGAHKFYQGKTVLGVVYVIFCWTMVPIVVGFIEGVRYLFMPLDDFYFQYYEK